MFQVQYLIYYLLVTSYCVTSVMTSCGCNTEINVLKDRLKTVASQLMSSQFAMEELLRHQGGSGILQNRVVERSVTLRLYTGTFLFRIFCYVENLSV